MRTRFVPALLLAIVAVFAATEAFACLRGRGAGWEQEVSMDVHDGDVRRVIEVLGEVAGANIVLSDDVRGRVSVKVRDVAARDVLDAVTRSRGLVVVVEGDVVLVGAFERVGLGADLSSRGSGRPGGCAEASMPPPAGD